MKGVGVDDPKTTAVQAARAAGLNVVTQRPVFPLVLMLSDHDCRDPDVWDERPSVPKRIIALTSGFLERLVDVFSLRPAWKSMTAKLQALTHSELNILLHGDTSKQVRPVTWLYARLCGLCNISIYMNISDERFHVLKSVALRSRSRSCNPSAS